LLRAGRIREKKRGVIIIQTLFTDRGQDEINLGNELSRKYQKSEDRDLGYSRTWRSGK
jgi:hypothetical protein